MKYFVLHHNWKYFTAFIAIVNITVSRIERVKKVIVDQNRSVRSVNPLNAELNHICHLLALLGGATIVVVSRLGVNTRFLAAESEM
jgi:hypothetical protein